MGETPLPLKSVVLFIACGTMVFIIVFIFAKRQITRFALKARGPHVPIGADAPKALKQEIERRLKRVGETKYEPRLLSTTAEESLATQLGEEMHFLYRMKAVDAIITLDEELKSYSPNIRRLPGQHTLRTFLMELRQSGPLEGMKVELIEKFTDMYDHARHDTSEFLSPQYDEYMELLDQVIEHIRNKKNEKHQLTQETIEILPEKAEKVSKKKPAPPPPPSEEKKEEVQITYRPATKGSGLGVMPMMPGTSSGSSQADVSSIGESSGGVPSSAGSNRGSGHFETSV